MPEREITIELKKLEIWAILVFLTVVLILNLQVSISSPIVFGDEGFHTRLAQWIAEEKEYPVWNPFEGTKLMKEGFSRPPLFNMLEASFLFVFGFNEIIIKFLTPFVAMLTGIGVFLLASKLYNRKVGFIASIISATIPSFVTYSVLFYTDVLFTFYFSLFALMFILANVQKNKKYWLLTGVFGAFSMLTKTPGYAIFPILAFGFLYQLYKRREVFDIIKKYFIVAIPIVVIISPFFLRNIVYYGTPDCVGIPLIDTSGCDINEFEAKYEFSGRTEQVGSEASPLKMGVVNYLNFVYGNIWFVPLAFLCGLFILISKKEGVNAFLLLVILTLVFMLYKTINTRAEDTARFTLGWVPIIALVGGIYLENLFNFIKKYQKYLALIVFVFVIFFGYRALTEKLNVMKQVKRFSPTFFEACDWVEENTPEDALISTIWTHRATYNCQRNVCGTFADIRLSEDIDYTLSVIEQHGITHLFIQKFSMSENPSLSEKYSIDFVQFLENNPDHFEKIYENGPPLEECLQGSGCDGNIIYEVKY